MEQVGVQFQVRSLLGRFIYFHWNSCSEEKMEKEHSSVPSETYLFANSLTHFPPSLHSDTRPADSSMLSHARGAETFVAPLPQENTGSLTWLPAFRAVALQVARDVYPDVRQFCVSLSLTLQLPDDDLTSNILAHDVMDFVHSMIVKLIRERLYKMKTRYIPIR